MGQTLHRRLLRTSLEGLVYCAFFQPPRKNSRLRPMNPFTDKLTPEEERIVDLTLRDLKRLGSRSLDLMCTATATRIGREVSLEEYKMEVCRVYLSYYRQYQKLGVILKWRQIHQLLRASPREGGLSLQPGLLRRLPRQLQGPARMKEPKCPPPSAP